jgi:hypothetical protein
MRYTLTQANGQVKKFYSLSCAELFQRSYGGVITVEESLAA